MKETKFNFNKTRPLENFSTLGQSFCIKNENLEGFRWVYETEEYKFNITDIFIKKETLSPFPVFNSDSKCVSTFIITGSGEIFYPYGQFSANTVLVRYQDGNEKFFFHAPYPFKSVSVEFKNSFFINNNIDIDFSYAKEKLFILNYTKLSKSLGKLAQDMIHLDINYGQKLYFDAKAIEWISVLVDFFSNHDRENTVAESDRECIEAVVKYIDDHYATDIRQELLERISMMSKSKLKYTFKNIMHMSITEYIQRKRMDVAENLLLTTDLTITEISKSVGYHSISRLSALFRRYKGILPKDLRNFEIKQVDCSKCNFSTNDINKGI